MSILKILLSLTLSLTLTEIIAKPFNLRHLPEGKDVTLLAPATTNVPLAYGVKLSPTDLPQTISFKAVSNKKNPDSYLIYLTNNLEGLRKITVQPGKTALYPFTKIESLNIRWEIVGKPNKISSKGHFLQVTSNKPMHIAR